jgi:transposase
MARPEVLELEEKKIKAIGEFAAATKSVREYKRAQAVLYKARGMSLGQIAQLLGVHWSTAQRYLARYKKYGVASFKDRPRPGRKPKLSEEGRKKLLTVSLKSPRLFGFLKNNWSLGMLRLYLKKETGIDISEVHIWRLLNKHKIVYKRPKLVAPGKGGRGAKKVENYKRVARALLKKG